jgi:hypothetical protein
MNKNQQPGKRRRGGGGDRVEASTVCLDRIQLRALLLRLEDSYLESSGERLSSSDFYDRYCSGEFDEPWGMAWATYYEAYVRMSRRPEDASVEQAAEALPPVLV